MAATTAIGGSDRAVSNAGVRWSSRAIDAGACRASKATCSYAALTASVPRAAARGFPPLDRKLKLRADHWSEGAAQVATEQGLPAKSFAVAATAFRRAVGG